MDRKGKDKNTSLTRERFNHLFYSPQGIREHVGKILLDPESKHADAVRSIIGAYEERNSIRNPEKENKAAATALAQEILAQREHSGKILAKEIEQNFSIILKNHLNYSKTDFVNKTCQLLEKICDYKIKMNGYPRSIGEMVEALNLLIGIMNRFDPNENVIISEESPYKYEYCIQLIKQTAQGLPKEYFKKVEIHKIKSVAENKSISTPKIIPQDQTVAAQNQETSKNRLAKKKKKAKKIKQKTQQDAKQDMGSPNQTVPQTVKQDLPSEPILQIKLLIHKSKKKLKSCFKKKPKEKSKRRPPAKAKKIKKVHWQDEHEAESKVIKTDTSSQDLTLAMKELSSIDQTPLLQGLEPDKLKSRSQFSLQESPSELLTTTSKAVGQSHSFWGSDSKSQLSSVTKTSEVSVDTKISQTTKKNGEVLTTFEKKISCSEKYEKKYEALPGPRTGDMQPPSQQFIHLEPAIMQVKFSLTCPLVVACLESIQAETKILADLLLIDQPFNDETLSKYFKYINTRNEHTKCLYEEMSRTPGENYNCHINPDTVKDIILNNWRLHQAFTNLFKDSEIMPTCISLYYDTFRRLQQIIPPFYWINITECYVGIPYTLDKSGTSPMKTSGSQYNLWNSKSITQASDNFNNNDEQVYQSSSLS